MIPKDPMMLYSVLNMKLRDTDMPLEDLIMELDPDADPSAVVEKLEKAGFRYNENSRRFE